ncbi:hypothetical protein [Bradyrhizobium uaiense]
MKAAIAAAIITAFGAPSFAAEAFYAVQDAKTKKMYHHRDEADID